MTDRRDPETLRRLGEHPLARALRAAAQPRETWLVGGAIRDALLGRAVARGASLDLDAVVERDAAGIAERLARELPARRVRLGGDRFAAERLVAEAGTLDLWDLAGGRLEDDLARRDFTINALALTADGDIVDLHGGRTDLAARRLRATRAGVFAEDPLRVVRLARFAATLEGFRVEPATAELSSAAAGSLRSVAGERIRQELLRLFPASPPARAQRCLERSGAWPVLWLPEDAGEPAVASAAGIARAVERRLGARLLGPDRGTERMALGHALASRGAAGAGRESAVAERLARRAILSGAERRALVALVELAGERPPAGDSDLRWFLHRGGALAQTALALGGALDSGASARRWTRAARRAAELLDERGAEILEPASLLDGVEIARETGLAPGPELGRVIESLRELQVRGVVTDRAGALAWLGRRRG
ncbi:MAG TPA: hypothetical protein VLA66_06510 [Thermoanaerobaculia bacterium]|nr:hypothetical protein [Thermoanaerobaculia bacterium]